MKKVLHMHSNIFDSTHQREIKSTNYNTSPSSP